MSDVIEQTNTATEPSTTVRGGVPERAATVPSGRLRSLDGLRGIAALVVVAHHLYQIAKPYIEPARDAWQPGSVWWWLSATPLKLTTAGSEAVILFFVLSGVVVPLPLLRGRQGLLSFYVSRCVRLLLPAWTALIGAVALVAFIPRPAGEVMKGSWLDTVGPRTVEWRSVLHDARFGGGTIRYDSVLWSLRWELVFAAVLPLLLVLARRVHGRLGVSATLAGCLALVIVGAYSDHDALRYLPVFALGILMATRVEAVRGWFLRRRLATGWALLAASGMMMVASWLLRPLGSATHAYGKLLAACPPLGSIGLVAVAIGFGPVRRALETALSQWFGRISFSLYLVHVPIIATAIYLSGQERWWLGGLIGVAISLPVAALFSRFVEQPSHDLAKRLGRRMSRPRETAA